MKLHHRWRLLAGLIASALVAMSAGLLAPTSALAAPATTNPEAFTYAPSPWSGGSWERYINVTGATARIGVNIGPGGGTITLKSTRAATNGIQAVSIDYGTETLVDLYSTSYQANASVYTSPFLPQGLHTLQVRVTGTRNPSATDFSASVNGASTTNGTFTSPAPPPTGVNPTLSVTASNVGTHQATLVWDYTAGSNPAAVDQIRVGRDGTDSNGTGPWSTTEAVADGQRVFLNLNASTTYTLYAELLKSGQVVGTRRSVRITTGTSGPVNQPPVAAFTHSTSNLTASFNASGSSDSDGTITGYSWNFGDGATATGVTASRVYTAAGSYIVTLTVTDNAGATSSTTRQVTVTAPSTGGPWLSGSSDEDSSFGDWRGDPQDSATTWADTQEACINQWQVNGGFANWSKPLVVAIGGKWTQTWSQAATGGLDSIWTQCLNALKAGWGSRPPSNLIISLFHESNGNWYDWSVTAGDLANFKAAWQRFRNLQKTILPDARLMLALNADHVQSGYTPEQMLPPSSQFDVLGLDMYSIHYPAAAGEGIGDWVARAAAAGKPLIIQEWGVTDDETAFVRYMRDQLVQHGGTGPGKIEMENYFNLWDDTYTLEPITVSPNAAALYRQLW